MFDAIFPAATAAARHHAEIEAPRESVGIVIDDGEYVPLDNVHPDPTQAFAIATADEDRYRGQVKAVIHSHVLAPSEFDPRDGPLLAGPSAADMAQQAQMSCPWGLVTVIDKLSHETVLWWGDSLPVAPLVGRPFFHGIFDCYSLIRDFYRGDEFGTVAEAFGAPVALPDFPRDFDWWTDRDDAGNPLVPKNLYLENFAAAGFRPIGRDELRAGDVFLAQVQAPVTNHGGIYLGDGSILHHLRRRLSRREPAAPWIEYITHFLRYEPR
jgi:cell wall-associated NlpC family hydrolase